MKSFTINILHTLLLAAILLPHTLLAEPYMAVESGLKCGSCHTNQTGGGKRTRYGNIYGQINMASPGKAQDVQAEDLWTGDINGFLSIGGDLRTSAEATATKNQSDIFEFAVNEAVLYLQMDALPNRLTLYLGEQLAPGAATSREAFAILWNSSRTLYLKAGRMFLPYGFRIQDDNSFMRQVSGINYSVSDDGIEAGLDTGPWSANLALTNGNAGGSETNKSKQLSFRGVFIKPFWRAGASYNYNRGNDGEKRSMANIFFGFKYSITSWLLEFDRVSDDSPESGKQEQDIVFLETNINVMRGHNLKITLEGLDPDLSVNNNYRTRNSLVWESVPIRFTQLRLGYRKTKGIPQSDIQNSDELFFQLHNYF